MRVLGIDPGTRVCGYACIECVPRGVRTAPRESGFRIRNAVHAGSATRPHLVAAGAIDLGSSKRPLAERLVKLADAIDDCVERFAPECIALEEAFFGKSVQSALRLGEARGVVLLAAARRALPIHQYAPATIKLRVAGHGAATKDALARMVGRAISVPVDEFPADVSDATAIALCHAWSGSTSW